jgi:3',5'-cyclic-AMP phosphodiesterase
VSRTVFAVEDDAAQVIVADAGSLRAVDILGLEPGAAQAVEVEGRSVSITTLAPPPGRLLSRVATLSDLHLGATHHFGVRDDPDAKVPFPMRCARAAVREARAWGAEAIFFKGDLTQHGRRDELEQLAEILEEIDVPVGLLLGNHDHRASSEGADVRASLADLGRPFDDVASLEVPGATVVLVDTTVPGREGGRLRHTHEHAVACAAAASGPTLVMLHHHLQPWPVPTAYPFGVPARAAGRFLDDLQAANPAIFVTSGHSHRNRARVRRGVPLTQVGSVKDFPGVWAGYAIHEGGIRQVVRRIAEPDCLEWNERTAGAMWGAWGRWTPGRLPDRCLTHVWPTR